MTQDSYDPSILEHYLKQHPNAPNKELYIICNATTDSQKGYIRKKKSRLQNEKDSSPPDDQLGDKKFESLTSHALEQMILDLLNEGQTESRVRIAVDFYIKVKSGETEGTDEIDMDGFLKLASKKRNEFKR